MKSGGVATVDGDGRDNGTVVRPVVRHVREGECDGLQSTGSFGRNPEGEGGKRRVPRSGRRIGTGVVKDRYRNVGAVGH